MATTGACVFSANLSPVFRRVSTSAFGKLRRNLVLKRAAVSMEQQLSTTRKIETTLRFGEKNSSEEEFETIRRADVEETEVYGRVRKNLKDYFDEAKDVIRSDGGPPRWFSPLECGSRTADSPLLLFLPGIDGVGLGLVRQHQGLGQIFDIWCLHIPVKDRTSFTDLVKLVERTVRSQNYRLPNRPIYLLGESLGACLALAVAAQNPDIDLVLVLANPATSFSKSWMRHLIPLLALMPDEISLSLPRMLRLMEGDSLRMMVDNLVSGVPLQLAIGELSQIFVSVSSYLSVVADILPKETLLWKLDMLKSASAYVNSRLHAVKAQTLILSSAMDQLLPSQEEGERLCLALSKCQNRTFYFSGHSLFLEDGVDLASLLKCAGFYRRGKYLDCVTDYMPLTPSEFNRIHALTRPIEFAASPVILSTLEDGTIVRGLGGLPSEGPVLVVGHHKLMGFEMIHMCCQVFMERKLILRGLAHPLLFTELEDGRILFETFRMGGAVPVSASNFYKLLSSKSHILLYPGGLRESLHRKGEEYTLFWPEKPEFVRMAARFGAKIIPFGVVGEDDLAEVVFDYNDQMKIPFMKSAIEKVTNKLTKLRNDTNGEVTNQDLHIPLVRPKFPGRLYYYFGKPIETEGRKQELRDRDKSVELYKQVKAEIEKYHAFLKEKREKDPYRNLLARLLYQATHGFSAEVPTFEL